MPIRNIALHALIPYGPSLPNRDDANRHKTAYVAGAPRLRISSQCLKRAWRTSDLMLAAMDGHGLRTQVLPREVLAEVLRAGAPEGAAMRIVAGVYTAFGPLKTKAGGAVPGLEALTTPAGTMAVAGAGKKGRGSKKATAAADGEAGAEDTGSDTEGTAEQGTRGPLPARALTDDELARPWGLAEGFEFDAIKFLTSSEVREARALVETCLAARRLPSSEELDALVDRGQRAIDADVAMFGRMAAADVRANVEAAVQVQHAITVGTGRPETDFYTAMDDLIAGKQVAETGSAMMGDIDFGSGTYYHFVNIKFDQLVASMGGDRAAAVRAAQGLVRAVCQSGPKAKINGFASYVHASYALLEVGTDEPATLLDAFDPPVDRVEHGLPSLHATAVRRLEQFYDQRARAFGRTNRTAVMDVRADRGALGELLALAAEV